MANTPLYHPATRWWLAGPNAFADWTAPTTTEFSDGITAGIIVDITCALNTDNSELSKDDSDTDDSTSFCQVAGAESPTFHNATIVLEVFRSKDELDDNTATTAFEWLAWPDIEYFVIKSVGEEPGVAVGVGDRLKMARAKTDLPVDVYGSGENIRLSNTMLFQGDLNWNYEVAA